jgi:LacI family transcriptional regulator
LQQRFQRVLLRSPKQELMRVQIDRAKMLLTQTDMTVELVAKRSGFAAFEYFVRAFRREVGITPLAYRKHYRVANAAPSLSSI